MGGNDKNILIVSYFYYTLNANALCLEPVINHLKKCGYNLHILFCHSKPGNPREGTIVYQMPSFLLKMKTKLDDNMNRTLLWKAVGLLFQYLALLLSFERKFESKFISSAMVSYATEIIKENNISQILSISHPIINHQLACNLKVVCDELKWTMYQLDPYTYNYALSEKEQPSRRKLELKLLMKADKVILTEGIMAENRKRGFGGEFEGKILSIPLPNLIFRPRLSDMPFKDFDETKINILFAGNIYSNIRKPEVIFEILSNLGNSEFHLHLYGWGMERIVDKYPKIRKQVHLHGGVPKEAVMAAMNAASVLINFGNSMSNQTPSKIFDYISTGKPIINFSINENDSSLHYLKQYPLFLNMFIENELSDSAIDCFEKFCRTHSRSFVQHEKIEMLYKELLSENVCTRVESYLSS